MNRYISFVFFLVYFLTSCSPKSAEVLSNKQPLPKRKDKELIGALDSLSKVKPKTFYSKLNVDFKDKSTNISFKTSLKIVTDSATNVLITYLKIPIVHAMITTDSVIVVNKRDKCVERQNLGYIRENFGVDFSYRNLEELLLGRPLDFYDHQRFFVNVNDSAYVVSTHKKRDRKRLDRKPKDDIVLTYELNRSLNELVATSVFSPSDSTKVSISYLTWQTVNNIKVPETVEIQVETPKNKLFIKLRYDKAEIDEPQELIIVIPDKYEKCR